MNLTSDDVTTLDGNSISGEDNINNEDDSRYTEESTEDKDDIENDDSYFNYGHSYDFEPDWLKGAKNQHTKFMKSV